MLSKRLAMLAVGGVSLFAISVPFTSRVAAQSAEDAKQGAGQNTTVTVPAQGAGAGQHTTVAAPPPGRTTGQHSTVAVPAQGGGMAPHPGAPMHMPMMGGGTAMVADGGHLYIVQGGMVFKVRKSDLNVERHQPLMHMPPNVMHPAPGRMPPPSPPARGGGGDKKD